MDAFLRDLFIISLSIVIYRLCVTTACTVGSIRCVKLYPNYPSDHQWAACLTDDYIKQKSYVRNKNHFCGGDYKTCWYMCMNDVHSRESGAVYDDCICDKRNPTTPAPQAKIPDWCYSPAGTSCNWYRECLEKAHPCSGSDTDYAIEYAEKFCSLYQEHYQKFSSNGQAWINAVRKCLQVELVPLLRQWRSLSCSYIRDTAFKSHTTCYVNPDKRVNVLNSFCYLSLSDRYQVFWTIKSAFVSVPWESLKGLLETMVECGEMAISKGKEKLVAFLKMELEYIKSRIRGKRSTDRILDGDTATEVADVMATEMKWQTTGVLWFGYSVNDTETDDNKLIVNILLAPEKDFNLNTSVSTPIDLNKIVADTASYAKNGKFDFNHLNVNLKKLQGCQTLACNETYIDVTVVSSSTRHMAMSIAFTVVAMFIVFID